MVPPLLSYCHGASHAPLRGDTVASCLDRAARARPDAEALVSPAEGLRYTYGGLRAEADRVACGLFALGLRPGDRVAMLSGNCAPWVVAQYASAKLGAILVGVNPALGPAELDRVLRQTGVSVLVATRVHMGRDWVAMLSERRAVPQVVLLGEGATPGWATPWAALLERGERVDAGTLVDVEASSQCDDPATILFTSGTTGAAKAATLSHHALVNSGFFIGERLGYTPADRVCVPVPLYHSIGYVGGILAAVTHGSTLVLPGPVFDPESCLAAVQAERCTSLYGVPSTFAALCRHPARADYALDSLRTGIIAGASCTAAVMTETIERLHLPELTTCYGLTETRCIFQSRRHDPLERRVTTVGVVHPHMECKVVDPATGRIVPRGVSGELCARGYGTVTGYWNDDDATHRAIDAARWFHTGDVATMSQDGYVTIVGRIKETIIRGGENVSAGEIEEVLKTCPKVADACVVGVPDGDYGEELCAWIRLKESETATDREIRRFCRQRVARHKVPRHVLFADSFPVTATGKVQKYRLREMAAAALSSAAPPSAAADLHALPR